jgi:hypothetical protein
MAEVTPEAGGSGKKPPSAKNGHDTDGGEDFDLGKYAYRAPGGGFVKREQLTIPEGRPKDSYFRIDPRPTMQYPVSILEYAPEGQLSKDVYILTPEVADQLGSRAKHAVIRVCICRPAILRLWAVKVPQTDRGTPNGYLQTAWDAIATLERQWGCLVVNESRTGYDLLLAETQWPDPEWRDENLGDLIHKAYRGRFVDSMDHEVVQKLRGRI